VAVVDPTDQLLEEVARLVLTEAPRLDDAVKQLPACCILHDYAQVRGRQVQLHTGAGRQAEAGRQEPGSGEL
jgi:hypothetical protein